SPVAPRLALAADPHCVGPLVSCSRLGLADCPSDAQRPFVGLRRRLALAAAPHCVGPLVSCSRLGLADCPSDAQRPFVGLRRRLALAADPHCVGPLVSCSRRPSSTPHPGRALESCASAYCVPSRATPPPPSDVRRCARAR